MAQNLKPKSDTLELIQPYGGELVSLLVNDQERDDLIEHAGRLPSFQLSHRSLCDLELLACGAFSPLDRFMGRADYDSVLENMRLIIGTLFPIPISLPLDESHSISIGQEIALRDLKNNLMAMMTIEEILSRISCMKRNESVRQQMCGILWSQKCTCGGSDTFQARSNY